MRRLDANAMKLLSFPDFDVERIECSLKDKKLKVFISGAWLDMSGGIELGKGSLYFSDWESFSIRKYDSQTKVWVDIEPIKIDPLKDICETNFYNSSVCLFGFGKCCGQWMEWKITKTKMSAEFSEVVR